MPPSVNQYWRSTAKNGRVLVYLSDQGKRYKQEVASLVKSAPSSARFWVRVDISFRDKRKNDLDNRLKSLFDALTGIIWHDDSQIDVMIVSRDQVGDNQIKITYREL